MIAALTPPISSYNTYRINLNGSMSNPITTTTTAVTPNASSSSSSSSSLNRGEEKNKPHIIEYVSKAQPKYASFIPNIKRKAVHKEQEQDILIDNKPFGRVYHLAVTEEKTGKPLYDLGGFAEPTGAIVIVIRQGDHKIALLNHYRPLPICANKQCIYDSPTLEHHGCYSLEFPRGFPEKKDNGDSAITIKREVLEEVGLDVCNVKLLGHVNANTAFMMSNIPLYAAVVKDNKDVSESDGQDEKEIIDGVVWVDVNELKKMIVSQRIECGLTLSGTAFLLSDTEEVMKFVDETL